MYLLIQAIPCILHLEMRVGLKILEMIIDKGLSNAEDNTLAWQQSLNSNSIGTRKVQLAEAVELVINEFILGTPGAPGQFKIRFEEDKATGNRYVLSKISLQNNAVRAIVNDMAHIIDKTVCGDEVQKLKDALNSYKAAMKILRTSKRDVTENEIKEFQKNVDDFHDKYVSIFGKSGLTNYIHYLSAGHIAEYMLEYGNLSKYSNQGWEALNSSIKCMYFRGTNKGGGGGKGDRKKSKLKAIGEWLQRRLLWLVVDTDAIFAEHGLSTKHFEVTNEVEFNLNEGTNENEEAYGNFAEIKKNMLKIY